MGPPTESGSARSDAARRARLLIAALLAAAGSGEAEDRFRLRVQTPNPARFYLHDGNRKAWVPEGAIAYVKRTENHFVVKNGFEIDLPPGSYSVTAERGPEYRPAHVTISSRAGEDRTIKLAPTRWIDMNGRGWFSGDLHNHRRPQDMPMLLLAEDLNLSPTISDWVWEDRQISMPPQTPDAIRIVDPTHVYSVLDKEVERLKNGPGAVDLLGLRTPVPFGGYLLHPPNDTFARQAHAQGGWVDAEKIVWRDIAALVAGGHIDFAGIVYNHFNRQDVETEAESWGTIPKARPEFDTTAGMPLWAMEVYYRFLNCGFRLPVSGGSASGVKASPPGYNRVYVKVAGEFSYSNWFRALKQGRSFATNGPMLFLTVDGKESGGVLGLEKGSKRRVKIHAEATSATEMDRLEIVYRGRTIRTIKGTGRIAVDFTTEIGETGWFTARAFEKPDRTVRFAHTSPIYVEVPGDRGIVREDARFFIDWIDREIAFYKNLAGFREARHRDEMLALFTSAREVYVALAKQ